MKCPRCGAALHVTEASCLTCRLPVGAPFNFTLPQHDEVIIDEVAPFTNEDFDRIHTGKTPRTQ